MKIDQELINQYETVRQLGSCNMIVEYDCVVDVAKRIDLRRLASLTKGEYAILLQHFFEHGYHPNKKGETNGL